MLTAADALGGIGVGATGPDTFHSLGPFAPLGGAVGTHGLGGADVTATAGGAWLADAQGSQQAELDLLRDAVHANSCELLEFKRYSTQVLQQVQTQVAEVRSKLSDVFPEGLRHVGQSNVAAGRLTLAEQVERLRTEVQSFSSGALQVEAVAKFSEVDKALALLRSGISGLRQGLTDAQQDWRKGQEHLGQAVSTLSQDFSDSQKHSSTMANKLRSDVFRVEEASRDHRDRLNRLETHMSGVRQGLYTTSNEVVLLRTESARPDRAVLAQQAEEAEQDVWRRGRVERVVNEGMQELQRSLREFGHACSTQAPGGEAAAQPPPSGLAEHTPLAAALPAAAAVRQRSSPVLQGGQAAVSPPFAVQVPWQPHPAAQRVPPPRPQLATGVSPAAPAVPGLHGGHTVAVAPASGAQRALTPPPPLCNARARPAA